MALNTIWEILGTILNKGDKNMNDPHYNTWGGKVMTTITFLTQK